MVRQAPFSEPARVADARALLPALFQELGLLPPLPLPSSLSFLEDTGLAHWHVALGDSGWLARIPKQSQMQLTAAANLAYQAACFERAATCGYTPALRCVIEPRTTGLPADAEQAASSHACPGPDRRPHGLPRGALIVQHIIGRPAHLPADLPLIAQALAALHTLPLPASKQRAPLLDAPDPLADLLAEIRAQWQAASPVHGQLAADTRAAIQSGLTALAALCAAAPRPAKRLISFDAHPGNFLIESPPRAILVDLEKCRYAYPGLDLAHATLYTSTTWDARSHAVLSTDEVARFYADWQRAAHAAEPSLVQDAQRWHLPLRRAMWLWSLTWCAKWLAHSTARASRSVDGEDWSAQHSDAALIDHVRERVLHYLHPATVQQVLAGLDELAQRLHGGP